MTTRESSRGPLIWLPDGHVSDWVLNALVDAELELVPHVAATHVDGCEHCTERLTTMAHLSFALGEELTFLSAQTAQAAPFPRAVFAAACLFSVSVVLFSWTARSTALLELPHELLTTWRGLRLIGPLAAQHWYASLAAVGSVGILASTIVGVIVAKRHPFTRSPESPS